MPGAALKRRATPRLLAPARTRLRCTTTSSRAKSKKSPSCFTTFGPNTPATQPHAKTLGLRITSSTLHTGSGHQLPRQPLPHNPVEIEKIMAVAADQRAKESNKGDDD